MNVLAEIESLSCYGVSFLRPCHVLIDLDSGVRSKIQKIQRSISHFGDGDIEVEVEEEDSSGE